MERFCGTGVEASIESFLELDLGLGVGAGEEGIRVESTVWLF